MIVNTNCDLRRGRSAISFINNGRKEVVTYS